MNEKKQQADEEEYKSGRKKNFHLCEHQSQSRRGPQETGRPADGWRRDEGGEREPSECLAHNSICAKKHARVSAQAELSDGVAATSKRPSGRSVGVIHCTATRPSQKPPAFEGENRQMSCNQAAGENTFTPRVEQSETSSAGEDLNGYNGLVSGYCAIIECRQTESRVWSLAVTTT